MVPTTETAKPILKQRKPPADPGPAPFKNVRSPKLINSLEKQKSPNSSASLPATPGSVARSRGRRLLFTPARRAPALALAGLPGTFGGAHARSWPCVCRGGAGRARARGCSSAARWRGWVRVPGRRLGRGTQRGAGGRCARLAAPREPPPPSTYRAPSPPLAARCSSEKACQHAARLAPTPQWLQAPGTKGAPAASRGLTVAGLAQCPAYSELSVGRENCCSCCYCSLLRRGPGCDIRTATSSQDCRAKSGLQTAKYVI